MPRFSANCAAIHQRAQWRSISVDRGAAKRRVLGRRSRISGRLSSESLAALRRNTQLISARYERRSLLITANQPFGDWGKIFPDQAMTLAANDRLVHHATILEMNVEIYRRKTPPPERGRRRGGLMLARQSDRQSP
jgi:hypothetical protein